jgi:hypothetical protein
MLIEEPVVPNFSCVPGLSEGLSFLGGVSPEPPSRFSPIVLIYSYERNIFYLNAHIKNHIKFQKLVLGNVKINLKNQVIWTLTPPPQRQSLLRPCKYTIEKLHSNSASIAIYFV